MELKVHVIAFKECDDHRLYISYMDPHGRLTHTHNQVFAQRFKAWEWKQELERKGYRCAYTH